MCGLTLVAKTARAGLVRVAAATARPRGDGRFGRGVRGAGNGGAFVVESGESETVIESNKNRETLAAFAQRRAVSRFAPIKAAQTAQLDARIVMEEAAGDES